MTGCATASSSAAGRRRLLRAAAALSTLVLAVVGGGLAVMLAVHLFSRQRIAEGVTLSGLRQLKPGMTAAEAQQLLGPPLAPAEFGNPSASRWFPSGELLLYAEPGTPGGLELYLHLDGDTVKSASAEHYDRVLWCCRPADCDPDALAALSPWIRER